MFILSISGVDLSKAVFVYLLLVCLYILHRHFSLFFWYLCSFFFGFWVYIFLQYFLEYINLYPYKRRPTLQWIGTDFYLVPYQAFSIKWTWQFDLNYGPILSTIVLRFFIFYKMNRTTRDCGGSLLNLRLHI